MQETLQNIVDSAPGAQAVVLMGFDGIAVMQAAAPEAEVDVESVAMEFSFRFIELRQAAEALELGAIHDIAIKADAGTVLVRVLTEEYFVLLLLEDARHVGKSRWVLRSQSSELAAQL